MNSKLSVSIVINNYNYGCFLRDAIDSALAQTYPHVEVIVVDDGSTDDSPEIIKSYRDKIIPVLKANGGQGSAVNAGFAASHGDIVIFLDADDVLLPQAAERVAEVWRPDVAKVQYWLDAIDENGQPRGSLFRCARLPASQMRTLLRRGALLNIPPTSANALSRRALAELLPMPEGPWRIGADGYLLPAVPFLGDVLTITEPLGLYRIHRASNWSAGLGLKDLRRRLLQSETALQAFKHFARKKNFLIDDGWLLGNPDYVSDRLESLRIEPAAHPYPGGRRFSLMLSGVRSSLSFPHARTRWRVFNALWMVFLGCAPRAALCAVCGLRHRMKQGALTRGPSIWLLRRLFGAGGF